LKIYRADAANALISSSANEPNEFEWRNPSDSFFFYQSTLTTFRADRPANQSAYCRSSKGKTFVCLEKQNPASCLPNIQTATARNINYEDKSNKIL
jgi:hypothetical protein